MKELYYTPSIEEFCVGFEYETYEPEEPVEGEKGFIWVKRCADECVFDSEINTMDGEMPFTAGFSESVIRVKYLDIQDLEDLGFVHIGGKLSAYGEQLFSAKKETGFNTGTEYIITYSQRNPCSIKIKQINYDSHFNHTSEFSFIVKNKSELRRLLKQIGYEKKEG